MPGQIKFKIRAVATDGNAPAMFGLREPAKCERPVTVCVLIIAADFRVGSSGEVGRHQQYVCLPLKSGPIADVA